MPNKKGGKSYKKAKKETNDYRTKPIEYKEDGEEYAIVKKMEGGGRVTLLMPDNTIKLGIIRGNMKRRGSWICTNDLVLVSIREFEDKKCDVIFKYMPTHINILKKKNHLTPTFINLLNNNTSDNLPEDNNIIFDEEEDMELSSTEVTVNKEIIVNTESTTNDAIEDFKLNWEEI